MPTVAPLDLEGHCIAVAWLDTVPVFAMADGTVHRLDDGRKTTEAHDGLLVAERALDGKSLVTGGEDGRVCNIAADGAVEDLGTMGRRWITAPMAAAASPACACPTDPLPNSSIRVRWKDLHSRPKACGLQ
jgi:hypothetical protein